jgi:hypothetical protein
LKRILLFSLVLLACLAAGCLGGAGGGGTPAATPKMVQTPEAKLSSLEHDLANAQALLRKKEETVESLRSMPPDFTEPSDVSAWNEMARNAQEEYASVKREVDRMLREKDALEKEIRGPSGGDGGGC